ncbi:DUF6612 family protein [Marinococcus sp. PL1-022]|uniref:DUF6612 family protein n=1 Tax=Marinococcus sp. PL1-022 TaxID=3095363 RepID=UPI0029C4371B|nr:DUF6612 family protein [Marinococcus sp. PL1-022]MDX6151738.1 DUF6612 family protein [Marinococcus sp. PL1-022]
MRKSFGVLLVSLILVLPIGCSSIDNEPDPTENQASDEEPASDEVLSESIDYMHELNRYSIDINMDQTIGLTQKDPVTNELTSHVEVGTDPFAYHESSTLQTTAQEPKEIERYLTAEGFFTYDSAEEKWIKYPDEFTGDLSASSQSIGEPAAVLELIEAYAADFQLEEKESEYVIEARGRSDQMRELVKSTVGFTNEDFDSLIDDMLFTGSLEDTLYTITIDKDSMQTKSIQADFQIAMNNSQSPQTTSSTQSLTFAYNEINNEQTISAPSNVVATAEELNFENLQEWEEGERFSQIEGQSISELMYPDRQPSNWIIEHGSLPTLEQRLGLPPLSEQGSDE